MHIPDGFLATPVWAALDAASVPAVAYLARRAQRDLEPARIPLLGVMGAFVFAAQMINFPVGVGTSGHLVGGALLAVTLGPAAASLVMTAILAVQALIFQDGGILALGANVFNMAVAGVLAGYLPYHFWGRGKARMPAIFAGAALSVLVGALLAIAQLLASGVPIRSAVLGLSLALFLVTALIEGAITVGVLASIERINPNWVRQPARSARPALGVLTLAAVLLAAFGVMWASVDPDGLEALAERAGIARQARALLPAPLAEYETRYFQAPWLRKASAGLAGLALTGLVCLLLARAVAGKRSS